MGIIDQTAARLHKSGADISVIGKSYCGNDLLCAHRGSYSGKQIIITAAIHARECYTALVVLNQIEKWRDGKSGGAYFIPLVNPDGAAFFESGRTFGAELLEKSKSLNKQWKANAQGVDLNCNFDARFGTGAQQNKERPSAHGYVGEYPLSAPETKALAEFTLKVKPSATVSYHCMGGELYWEFFQRENRLRDKTFATAVAKHIGVKRVDGDLNSAGGYKDWCVIKLGIPAFTIELIKRGSHPFAPDDFIGDIALNADLPKFILDHIHGESYER